MSEPSSLQDVKTEIQEHAEGFLKLLDILLTLPVDSYRGMFLKIAKTRL